MAKCEHCRKDFTPLYPRQRHCTVNCRRTAARLYYAKRKERGDALYNKGTLRTFPCKRCGKTVETTFPHKKYCSLDCQTGKTPRVRTKPKKPAPPKTAVALRSDHSIDPYFLSRHGVKK